MRKNNVVFLLLVLGLMTPARNASGERSTDEQVKRLTQRYAQVEEQLDRSVHYVKKESSGAETTIEQAWFNGAGDPIKVATEHSDGSGRELTEYFALNFDRTYDGMFMLMRKEMPLPDGGTQVDESRKYLGERVVLIRELKKSARFKAGESTDTVHVPNVAVDLAKRPPDGRNDEEHEKSREEILARPEKIATALQQAGPPDFDPFASLKGDSEKFRVIHGTVSPDGRYAIALGFARSAISWDDFVDKDFSEDVKTYYAENDEDVRNYVVDLARQKILGETGCNYFATRRSYNRRECIVTWSPDSMTFVQLWRDYWNYVACRAGRIAPGPKLLGVVDLGTEAGRKALAAAKRHYDADSDEDLSIAINQVSNDGVVDMEVYSVDRSRPHKGETIFSYSERMRLRATPAGLRAELLAIRRMSKEQ